MSIRFTKNNKSTLKHQFLNITSIRQLVVTTNIPEEVLFAVDFVSLAEALVTEMNLTVGALETLGMPGSLQYL